MKITHLAIRDAGPVERFDVRDIGDRLVIAGPNGVGKSQLLLRLIEMFRDPDVTHNSNGSSAIVSATDASESKVWEKDHLDLTHQEDRNKFRATMQANRRKRLLTSSVLAFEGDRTVANIQKLAFDFELPDPDEETDGWDVGFRQTTARYQDVVHSLLKLIERRDRNLVKKVERLFDSETGAVQLDELPDPLTPFRDAFERLLPSREFIGVDKRSQQIQYRRRGEDETLTFQSLSSGEREVVIVAFDFILRRPTDCIVLFDEPELHLHPELTERFLRTLEALGTRNQLVLFSHSADLISASLTDSLVFLSPPREANLEARNQAVPFDETEEAQAVLRDIGHSLGVIALGRRIVLIEGDMSSSDVDLYKAVATEVAPNLVLVPSKSRKTSESFGRVLEEVLSKTLWGVDFFMLVDSDSELAFDASTKSTDRFRLLPRYCLENYLLDPGIWYELLSAVEASPPWGTDRETVQQRIDQLVLEHAPRAAATAVAHRVRASVGGAWVLPADLGECDTDQLSAVVNEATKRELDRLTGALDPGALAHEAAEELRRIADSISTLDGYWSRVVSGKPIFSTLASEANLKKGQARKLYLKSALRQASGIGDPFEDLKVVLREFDRL